MNNNITTNKSKNEAMDIQSILEKIKTLSISNDDKALLMKQFKYNIMNPSLSDNKDLETIHKKYLDTSQHPQQIQDTNFINTNPHHYNPQHYNLNQYNPNQYNPNMPIQSNNLMTTAHFEILKNKIDTVQFELIDLLRHVKDYTQKYMTSVRQQDLEKIDEYIKGLFEVDKKLKETTDKSEMVPQTLEGEGEEPATEESVITRATSGIKNFMGNIGKNVSGITSLVKSTSDIANNYLSKNIITTPEEEKKLQTTTINSKINTNKNVVSIDEYIKSNENRLNNNTPIQEQKKKEAEIEEGKSEEKEEEENTGNNNEEEKEEEEENTDNNEEESELDSENRGNNNEEENTDNNEQESELADTEDIQEKDIQEEDEIQEEEENLDNNKAVQEEENEIININSNNINNSKLEEDEDEEETTPDNLGNALNELNQKMKTDIDNTIVNTSNSNKTDIQQGGSFNSKLHTKLENNIKLLKLKLTKKKLLKKLTISNQKKLNKNKMSKHKLQKNKKNNKKTKHIK